MLMPELPIQSRTAMYKFIYYSRKNSWNDVRQMHLWKEILLFENTTENSIPILTILINTSL